MARERHAVGHLPAPEHRRDGHGRAGGHHRRPPATERGHEKGSCRHDGHGRAQRVREQRQAVRTGEVAGVDMTGERFGNRRGHEADVRAEQKHRRTERNGVESEGAGRASQGSGKHRERGHAARTVPVDHGSAEGRSERDAERRGAPHEAALNVRQVKLGRERGHERRQQRPAETASDGLQRGSESGDGAGACFVHRRLLYCAAQHGMPDPLAPCQAPPVGCRAQCS